MKLTSDLRKSSPPNKGLAVEYATWISAEGPDHPSPQLVAGMTISHLIVEALVW